VDVPWLTDPDRPDLSTWLAELRAHLELAAGAAERLVLAHSLGATLWLHHAAGRFDRRLRVNRVLLVAPPGPNWHEPDVVGFHPAPLDRAGLRQASGSTRLVVGSDDPACSATEAVRMATTLGVDLDVIPHAGHLNTASGYGPWPAVLDWARTAATPLRAAR
jgi:predicted alpha/beta hydrolase family esterase